MSAHHEFTLQQVDRFISMEAYGDSSFDAIAQQVRRFLPNVGAGLMQIYRSLDDTTTVNMDTLSSDQRKFVQRLQKLNYANIANLTIQVPNGFNGEYAEATKELQLTCAELKNIIRDVVVPYRAFLLSIVNADPSRIQTNLTDMTAWTKLSQFRKEHTKRISALYTSDQFNGTATYGDVIKRNSQWSEIFPQYAAARADITSVDNKQLKTLVNDCATYIDTLHTNLSQDGGKMAQEVARKLSFGALVMAEHIELYALTRHRVSTIGAGIDRAISAVYKAYGEK